MQLGLAAVDKIFYQSEQLEISSAVARTADYPVHCHPVQFQLEVVLRGATMCGIGQQRFLIPQQCYSMVNPDVEHYNVTQRWKHALFILFPRQTLDETAWQIYRLWSRPVVFSDVVAPCSPALATIVHVLFHEASQPALPGRMLLFDSALIQLSVLLLRSLRGNHTAWAIASGTPRPVWAQIARAVDLMQSCYRDELSLDDLARAAAMSRYHFLRSFKAHVGITPYGCQAYGIPWRPRTGQAAHTPASVPPCQLVPLQPVLQHGMECPPKLCVRTTMDYVLCHWRYNLCWF